MQLNKSFARRIGKGFSNLKQSLLKDGMPKYLFNPDSVDKYCMHTEIVLEIGFGMGDHFIHQIKTNSNKFFIGAEVYLNGVVNVLKSALEHQVQNFALWPDDIDLILNALPDNSLRTIYILFPDPWPKKRQHKKRLINEQRLNIFADKLKLSGQLIFASDIEEYFMAVNKLISGHSAFALLEKDSIVTFPENYIPTKYHKKALRENRIPQFLYAVKSIK